MPGLLVGQHHMISGDLSEYHAPSRHVIKPALGDLYVHNEEVTDI